MSLHANAYRIVQHMGSCNNYPAFNAGRRRLRSGFCGLSSFFSECENQNKKEEIQANCVKAILPLTNKNEGGEKGVSHRDFLIQ